MKSQFTPESSGNDEIITSSECNNGVRSLPVCTSECKLFEDLKYFYSNGLITSENQSKIETRINKAKQRGCPNGEELRKLFIIEP